LSHHQLNALKTPLPCVSGKGEKWKGGFLGLVAGIELVLATWILSAGVGGWRYALILLGWEGVAHSQQGRVQSYAA
jgi:hypothetical protein